MKGDPGLSLGEWAVLTLVSERRTHGWPVVRALAAEGEIGQIWTVRRAAVYRALEVLEAGGLVATLGVQSSPTGPTRTMFAATRRGAAAVRRWLVDPVDHVRDLRSELLLKLVFGGRAGIDQRAMLERQRAMLTSMEASFGSPDDLLGRFRLESTRAAIRFVDGQLI